MCDADESLDWHHRVQLRRHRGVTLSHSRSEPAVSTKVSLGHGRSTPLARKSYDFVQKRKQLGLSALRSRSNPLVTSKSPVNCPEDEEEEPRTASYSPTSVAHPFHETAEPTHRRIEILLHPLAEQEEVPPPPVAERQPMYSVSSSSWMDELQYELGDHNHLHLDQSAISFVSDSFVSCNDIHETKLTSSLPKSNDLKSLTASGEWQAPFVSASQCQSVHTRDPIFEHSCFDDTFEELSFSQERPPFLKDTQSLLESNVPSVASASLFHRKVVFDKKRKVRYFQRSESERKSMSGSSTFRLRPIRRGLKRAMQLIGQGCSNSASVASETLCAEPSVPINPTVASCFWQNPCPPYTQPSLPKPVPTPSPSSQSPLPFWEEVVHDIAELFMSVLPKSISQCTSTTADDTGASDGLSGPVHEDKDDVHDDITVNHSNILKEPVCRMSSPPWPCSSNTANHDDLQLDVSAIAHEGDEVLTLREVHDV